jgi:hypothetical protein
MSTKTQFTALSCATLFIALALTCARTPGERASAEPVAPVNPHIRAPLNSSASQPDSGSSLPQYKPRQALRKGSLLAAPTTRSMVA